MNRPERCTPAREPLTIVTRVNAPSLPIADHQISVVIPVYGGEAHLTGVVAELEPYTLGQPPRTGTATGCPRCCSSHDCGPDDSARVMRALDERTPSCVRCG